MRSPRALLLLAALAASPLGAQTLPGGWRLSVRAEQSRFGDYLRNESSITTTETFGTSTEVSQTALRFDPMSGARATLSRMPAGSGWGALVDVAWGRGMFYSDMSTTWGAQFGTDSPLYSQSTSHFEDRASYWSVRAGVARRIGSDDAPVWGTLSLQPTYTVLRVPFVSDPSIIGPPSLGGFVYTPAAPRTHSYRSPGAALGGALHAALGRGFSLELAASAEEIRSAGDEVARDFNRAPWGLSGSGPIAYGTRQWRPVTTFGVGLAYRP